MKSGDWAIITNYRPDPSLNGVVGKIRKSVWWELWIPSPYNEVFYFTLAEIKPWVCKLGRW